jgi:hypothetical protein
MNRLTSYGQSYDRLGPEMLPYCGNELVDRKKCIKGTCARKLIERRLKPSIRSPNERLRLKECQN